MTDQEQPWARTRKAFPKRREKSSQKAGHFDRKKLHQNGPIGCILAALQKVFVFFFILSAFLRFLPINIHFIITEKVIGYIFPISP